MTTPDERPPETAPNTPRSTTTFEERAESLGREAEAAADRFGREAEAAADRFASYPAVRSAGSAAVRIWGLVLLATGLWLFASITLHVTLPNVAWDDAWPLILIALGLLVVFGSSRRRARQ